MTASQYTAPVDQLLTLDRPTEQKRHNYLDFGLGPEHVPDLIRLAVDDKLRWEGEDDNPAVYAPVHAWYALGQLRIPEAVGPLLTQLHHIDDDDDDWAGEELPDVLTQIGPAAIAPLSAYVASPLNKTYATAAAARALQQIGVTYPETHAACVQALARRLEQFEYNDEGLNAFLISDLVELKATAVAPLMERAFAAGRVDEMVRGDWEDVQIDLGLKEKRDHPRPLSPLRQMFRRMTGLDEDDTPPRPVPDHIREWNERVEAKKRAKDERAPKPRKRRR